LLEVIEDAALAALSLFDVYDETIHVFAGDEEPPAMIIEYPHRKAFVVVGGLAVEPIQYGMFVQLASAVEHGDSEFLLVERGGNDHGLLVLEPEILDPFLLLVAGLVAGAVEKRVGHQFDQDHLEFVVVGRAGVMFGKGFGDLVDLRGLHQLESPGGSRLQHVLLQAEDGVVQQRVQDLADLLEVDGNGFRDHVTHVVVAHHPHIIVEVVRRHEHALDRGVRGFHLAQQLEPGHVRHVDVGQDHVESRRGQLGERGRAVRRGIGLVTENAQCVGEHVPDGSFVIHYEDLEHVSRLLTKFSHVQAYEPKPSISSPEVESKMRDSSRRKWTQGLNANQAATVGLGTRWARSPGGDGPAGRGGPGAALVLAGAGSGKTTVLTRRTAFLMEAAPEGDGILALTFTKDAAGEMEHRLQEMLPEKKDGAGFPYIGTFHAFAFKLVRSDQGSIPNWRRLGFSRCPALMDPAARRA